MGKRGEIGLGIGDGMGVGMGDEMECGRGRESNDGEVGYDVDGNEMGWSQI